MTDSFELNDLDLPEDSPCRKLLEACPDIELIRFQEGEYLIEEGDDTADTFLVLRGGYVVESSSRTDSQGNKKEILTSALTTEQEPSFVGEMAYLGSEFRTASVRSVGSTYTLCLKPRHVDILINDFPFFTRILCRQFTKRLAEANKVLRIYRQRFTLEAEQKFLPANEILFRSGEKAEKLYQLVKGKLVYEPEVLEKTAGQPEILSGFVEPLEFLRGGIWPKTVLTATNAVLIEIDGSSRLAVIRSFPEMALELLKKIPSR